MRSQIMALRKETQRSQVGCNFAPYPLGAEARPTLFWAHTVSGVMCLFLPDSSWGQCWADTCRVPRPPGRRWWCAGGDAASCRARQTPECCGLSRGRRWPESLSCQPSPSQPERRRKDDDIWCTWTRLFIPDFGNQKPTINWGKNILFKAYKG